MRRNSRRGDETCRRSSLRDREQHPTDLMFIFHLIGGIVHGESSFGASDRRWTTSEGGSHQQLQRGDRLSNRSDSEQRSDNDGNGIIRASLSSHLNHHIHFLRTQFVRCENGLIPQNNVRFHRFESLSTVEIPLGPAARADLSDQSREEAIHFVSFSDAKSRMWMWWNIERTIQSLWSLFDNDMRRRETKNLRSRQQVEKQKQFNWIFFAERSLR